MTKEEDKNTSTVSECCSHLYDSSEGRCRQCFEGCVGVEVCNECSEDLENCECEERCNDCEAWDSGSCFSCKMD